MNRVTGPEGGASSEGFDPKMLEQSKIRPAAGLIENMDLLLDWSSSQVRQAISEALRGSGNLARDFEVHQDTVRHSLLVESDPQVLKNVLAAIDNSPGSADRFVVQLAHLLRDDDPRVRERTVELLLETQQHRQLAATLLFAQHFKEPEEGFKQRLADSVEQISPGLLNRFQVALSRFVVDQPEGKDAVFGYDRDTITAENAALAVTAHSLDVVRSDVLDVVKNRLQLGEKQQRLLLGAMVYSLREPESADSVHSSVLKALPITGDAARELLPMLRHPLRFREDHNKRLAEEFVRSLEDGVSSPIRGS